CSEDVAVVRQADCTVAADMGFSLMTCDPASGITFSNDLKYTEQLNPYTYRNFYNGGGVGLGDFNGDGLLDIFFTGNLVENKLYLNRGDFNFEDVTEAAGVACPDSWSTGVAVVDIDQDGDEDIYVCKAGPPAGEEIPGMTGIRHNELFLNNGDATFREASAEFGLDVVGLSVHSAFFDYDGDGDLDCYLLNNSTRSTTGYDFKEGLREIPDPEGGNKLLRNDGGKFVDVTTEAGIYSSTIGFGLGVTVGDVNDDHLPDLFVSNDFFERDYLYFNNGDGTFREDLPNYLPEISQGSMGADFADLNNDGLPELFVTEMLPRTNYRRKTKAAFNGWNRYQLYRDRGYHQQFSRNVLQLNRGGGRFSEISRMLDVDATDWSWGALLFDLNNDGYRDIFVANGNGKDLLDQDYINFDGSQDAIRSAIRNGKTITDIIDKIPAEKLVNGVFVSEEGVKMTEAAATLGLDQKTFSNGAAYGDLDNDGDLDLVVNNIDDLAGVYRNNTANPGLTLHLRHRQ
ncbi:MAG: VCBS repeat-containing protein, partial [Bacteroidota bacterium]